MLRSTAGATAWALLIGGVVAVGLVAASPPALAATIPTNPCVRPEPMPVTTKPVVTRVSTSARVIDVRRRAKTLVVTVTAHDTVAVTRMVVTVSKLVADSRSPRFTPSARLVSGTAIAGTWQADVQLPRFIPTGTYRVERVLVFDAGGGRSAYFRSTLPDAWPARMQVRSITDRTAPTVTRFRLSARALDTRTAPTTLTLRVHVRDDLSGVAKVRVRGLGVRPARQPWQPPLTGFSTALARSTGHAHTWSGRVVVPMWAASSTWNLWIKVVDRRDNRRNLHADDLARRGWQSTVRVTSGVDSVQPALVDLSFTPTTVDARSGAVRVAVSYRLRDSQSGPSDSSQIVFQHRGMETPVVTTSVSGTTTDRTYQGYLDVPQCGFASASTLTVGGWLYDNAFNERGFSTALLDDLGLPSQLPVLQRDSLAPSVDRSVLLTAGSSLPLRFWEPVLMAAPMSTMVRVAVNGATTTGAWVCRNGAGEVVVCDADDAAVTTATFTPTTAFTTGQRVIVSRVNLPPARSGIYDLDGVPLTDLGIDTTVR
jgi:hypothetical protein